MITETVRPEKNYRRDLFWMGKPLEDCSAKELMAAVEWAYRAAQRNMPVTLQAPTASPVLGA